MIRTWVPEPTFAASATVLHDEEVFRVRQHALFILGVLAGHNQHMRHNPVVTMWRGAELILVSYGVTMCREWRTRGHSDKLEEQIYAYGEEALRTNVFSPDINGNQPWWLANEGFHLSHRSNLINLRPDFYGKIWPGVPKDLPLVMPTGTAAGGGRLAM